MIIHSIKWRLQLWHGAMLVAVLAGFGVTAYELQRTNFFRHIDQDLQQRNALLLGELRAPGPRERGGPGGDFPGEPRERNRPEGDFRGGPRPGRPEDGPRPLREDGNFPAPPPRDLRLSARISNLFGDDGADAFYYVIWRRDGEKLQSSTNAPAGISQPPRTKGQTGTLTQMRGERREAYQFTPPGECILVGRSITPELAAMRRFAWLLAGAGGAVLLLGLAGGWWIATRAIRPIDDISATAEKISAGDLSQRIDATDAGSELGQLAAVLNSTFARLDAAFTQQKQFTSDAAHELRTPVSVILTQTQSTLNRERSAAEYRETLEACQRAAQRMRRLVESLLDLAKLDSGQVSLQCAPLDLAQTAAECLELVRPLASERGIALQSDLAPANCEGDSDRLALVITNLLTNAIHHNRDGGEVRIVTSNGDGEALLTVADNGPGIAVEHLPRIFDRFYRADAARTASQGRAGLGLAISKSIVDAHGGTLEVASQPGAGATFTVRLPAAMYPPT